jgi:GNAT superfamily N-acetyltransferase
MANMSKVEIKGYVPGAIGRIAELHGRYYSREWGFGKFFEAKVAAELAAFVSRLDEAQDGLWTVCLENRVQGAIAIDGIKARTDAAHLRWFILSTDLKGGGLGNQLLGRALGFCREKAYKNVFLWTFQGLDTARHLYEKHGFKLAEESKGSQWGTTVIEQKFILEL